MGKMRDPKTGRWLGTDAQRALAAKGQGESAGESKDREGALAASKEEVESIREEVGEIAARRAKVATMRQGPKKDKEVEEKVAAEIKAHRAMVDAVKQRSSDEDAAGHVDSQSDDNNEVVDATIDEGKDVMSGIRTEKKSNSQTKASSDKGKKKSFFHASAGTFFALVILSMLAGGSIMMAIIEKSENGVAVIEPNGADLTNSVIGIDPNDPAIVIRRAIVRLEQENVLLELKKESLLKEIIGNEQDVVRKTAVVSRAENILARLNPGQMYTGGNRVLTQDQAWREIRVVALEIRALRDEQAKAREEIADVEDEIYRNKAEIEILEGDLLVTLGRAAGLTASAPTAVSLPLLLLLIRTQWRSYRFLARMRR